MCVERGRNLAETPKPRLDPGHQLTWAERLGEVVIRADGQSEDFVNLFSSRSITIAPWCWPGLSPGCLLRSVWCAKQARKTYGCVHFHYA